MNWQWQTKVFVTSHADRRTITDVGLRGDEHAAPPSAVSLDALADELQELRAACGDVSFGEIATRIARSRELHGVAPAAARIARSSVHAAFAKGRTRLNPDLVAEIVFALVEDESIADEWRVRAVHTQERARLERRASAQTASIAITTATEVSADGVPVTPPAPAGRAAAASERPQGAILVTRPSPSLAARTGFSPLVIALILVSCIGLNHFGTNLNARYHLPLFLDMIGTAVASILLGPWSGAAVGLISNTLGAIAENPNSMAFALVNVVGALIWGYGVRAWRMRAPWWRFFLLNLIVAVGCTLVAVPINVLVFGGIAEGHASFDIVSVLTASGEGIWRAVFSVSIAMSLADKLIAGYLALGIVHLIDANRSIDPGVVGGRR